MRPRLLLAVLVAAVSMMASPQLGAQTPGRAARLGVLSNEAWAATGGLRHGLQEHGYVEGHNLRLEYRWVDAKQKDFTALSAELISLGVDVIVTWGTPATLAAQQVARNTPIVMAVVGDPVGSGLVESLARPGRRTTGLSSMANELEAKRLELLKDMLPQVRRVGVLTNLSNRTSAAAITHMELGAGKLGLELATVSVRDETQLRRGLDTLRSISPEAVLVAADPFVDSQANPIAGFLVENRLPSIYSKRILLKRAALSPMALTITTCFVALPGTW